MMLPFLVAAIVVAGLAAISDWRTGAIPDRLTLPVLLGAPVAYLVRALGNHVSMDEAVTEAGWSLGGAIACAIIPLILYRQSAIGFGDVKLFAALGALLQPAIGFEAETYGFVAAALLAPARLAYEGKLLKTLKNTLALVVNPFMPKEKRHTIDQEMMSWFRLGPAIFVGTTLAALLHWRAR
jgi:prepilin peptidase CpaA